MENGFPVNDPNRNTHRNRYVQLFLLLRSLFRCRDDGRGLRPFGIRPVLVLWYLIRILFLLKFRHNNPTCMQVQG